MANRTTTSPRGRSHGQRTASAPRILTPNLDEAQRFLAALDPNPAAVFRFRVFADKNSGSSVGPRVLVGTLAQHAATLTRLNQAKAGIFVLINESSGDTDASVTRIRAYFADKDGTPLQEFFDAPHQPDIITETSADKYHGYWLTSNAPLEEFAARQRLLAARFHGDPKVCNPARVMRVPGFWHQKDGVAFLSRIIKLGDEVSA